MWRNSHKWGKSVNVNVLWKLLCNRICACIHIPDGHAAVGSRGALRFDSPGSKISYILILYSAYRRCKITNRLVNTWEEITELQGLRAHAIVLNPCLHTICHGRSPDLAFDTVVEIKHAHWCPADDCAGFFDILICRRVTHPSFWSQRNSLA